MRSTRTLLALGTAGVAMLTLAGCTGSGEGKAGDLSWEDSPLGKYMAAGYDSSMSEEEQQKQFDAMNAKIEESVATCMSKAGFDYTPVDSNGGVIMSSDDDEEVWDPEDEKWVAQWGYGIVQWPGMSEASDPASEEGQEDPNEKYVATLSETAQGEYYETLYGPQPSEEEMAELEESGEETEYDWKNAGCYGAAQHEVNGESAYESEKFAGLMDAINEFYSETYDGAPTEADKKWSACMADAGAGEFEKQSKAQDSIYDELMKIQEALYPDTGKPGESGDEKSEEPVDEEQLDPKTNPDLKALHEKEVKLATADLACRKKTDFTSQQLKDQFAAEEKFVAEHKAELEAFKAAAEAEAKKSQN